VSSDHFFRAGREQAPDPPGWVGGAPTDPTGHSCAVCGARDVVWVHLLDDNKVRFSLRGQGQTLSTYWALCDRCEALLQAGDDEGLVELMKSGREDSRYVDQEVRTTLAAFGAADRQVRRFAEPPAGVLRLREQGFEPLHSYTGAVPEIWAVWPDAQRAELAAEVEDDEERRLFVRSPWSTVTVSELITLLGPWVWPSGAGESEPDPTAAARILTSPADQALTMLASRHTGHGETSD
jgi:hypothetical protein